MKKIEEIRQKPEHIRMRYVWGWVGISMVLVVFIWYLSLKSAQPETTPQENIFTPNQMQAFDNLKVEKQSIEDATNKLQEGINQTPGNTGNNSPQKMQGQ